MAVSGAGQDGHTTPSVAALKAIVALLVEEREERLKDARDAVKVEVLLTNAGLSVSDIVAITGRKPDTVRKALSRAKAK